MTKEERELMRVEGALYWARSENVWRNYLRILEAELSGGASLNPEIDPYWN